VGAKKWVTIAFSTPCARRSTATVRRTRRTSGTSGSRSDASRVKTYVVRRLLALVPVAVVVATVAFILIHLAPGDPASIIAGPDASPAHVARPQRPPGLAAPLSRP